MVFSLVIPTYNNLAELESCLSFLEQVDFGEFEVLICVDGSTDGTLAFLKNATLGFSYRVLTHADGRNHGRSAARNLALPHLQGKYTLFLDSDMRANPDFLLRHQEILEAGSNISLGPVEYVNGKENLWARYIAERGICKFSHGEAVPFHYFITPNTAVPTEWVKAVGGFDEQINRYGGEDMELGYRIFREFSPQYIYNAKAVVRTRQEKSLDKALNELREYGATGLRYIVRRWPDLGQVYWVNKVESRALGDRLFEWLTGSFFQKAARSLIGLGIYPLQKVLINYLVVSAVHQGYRTGSKN